MEVKDVETRDHTLTPAKLFRGLLCLLVLLLTAFMMLVYYGFISAIFVRVFSIHYSRKATSFFFGSWLALWPFLFEKINKTKVIFSGEVVPARERVLLIANHRTEVDWMYLWDLAIRKGQLGYIKYILKSSLMKLPVFGWAFHILEFISVERKWEVDELTMHQMLSTFKDYYDPFWLALFPEGTDFTDQKCIRSQKYAAEKGLPILKNVLLPKTKGFRTCLHDLRKCLDAVYDVTIGYKHRCPSLLDNVFGLEPSEVHIHIQRIPLHHIPTTENEVANWLMNTFRHKDQLLEKFHSQGHFPHEGTEGDLSTLNCLVSIITVMLLTSISTYFTFFSSIWFKIYVSLACSFLAFATRFNIRPMPIFGHKKSS
ncbi:probable 1-acyl-sn-glycerol-3-phosphate acyltransferase 5 [Benincasa hispida]|uniref:probable 1-acyl-sn-glycerol-3-phosphate acyltransferase 5 n=1 Tax=Benincasa hispida TaxID=102211 RepID=UPI0019023CBA|nr:probable 1-acyl-sn-glycerol-3-phosphate acyltransferase 5 [Benincasa hispida]XP_038887316.1 probable 1-acyl-sn-glycerol-3-phosphate acyltransferase 5 [Benincasa hispida]XP_038887317.1 probable 1-acyl-sn-glycerol-3-phosphate acyltransferase 5 [Benincasa hispida]XP_038887318.1 probable 1-acyl-sn-glycerol-3-phosphate acyltransferase 5 [Benincasa hispida]XP_038887319.1 probable 1-acyl-sn-glycerol-3-phosphate acyltransferase 5 [Benincasa hispida]